MAFHERSSITTRLTIVSEGSKWSWVIEHDGKIYTSGTPPASGPAVFNELSTANASVVTNFAALKQMAHAKRRASNAVRTMEAAQGGMTSMADRVTRGSRRRSHK